MEAEEILGHTNPACEIPMTIEVVTAKDAIRAMHDYARIQIEKDRERVKAKARKADHFNAFVYVSDIDETPITLD